MVSPNYNVVYNACVACFTIDTALYSEHFISVSDECGGRTKYQQACMKLMEAEWCSGPFLPS